MNAWFPRVTLHTLVIVASVLTYILTTRAVRERRPPSIAIAWVLGLIALPYVVLPMYLMFGRRKLPRKTSTRGDSRTNCNHWAEDLIVSFDLAPAAEAAVRMHKDGEESAAALFEIMSRCRRRLDLCTYILGNDPFGREAMTRMAECVKRGVQVRLLLDGVGAIQLPRWCFERLQAAGIETAIFSPLFARHTQGPRNLRNHRKMVIADGNRLWTGGRNIAAEYFTGSAKAPAWQDLSFDLDGKVAAAAAAQFEADWIAAGGKPATEELLEMAAAEVADAALKLMPDKTTEAPVPTSAAADTARMPQLASMRYCTGLAQFLPSGPDQTEDTVHALLIDACFQVHDRILAVTPYFVPDNSLETALRLAAHRGVRIDLCIPARSNHRLADYARNRSLRALSRAGVRVHLLPHMVHAKAIIFDRSIAISGSVNLDSRSLLLNYECAVVFYGADEIDWLSHWTEALIPRSRPFDARSPNIFRDIGEGLLLTVAYQL